MSMTKDQSVETINNLDLVEMAVYDQFTEFPEKHPDGTSPDDLQACWFYLTDALQALVRYGRTQGWEWGEP